MKIVINILILTILFAACRKDQQGASIPPAAYLIANTVTGPGPTAITTTTNSASSKVSAGPAIMKLYVNTPQSQDVTITYHLSGTAQAGVNYTPPSPTNATIKAGSWTTAISIPVINTPLTGGNKTIILTLDSASDPNMQMGLGAAKTYNTFTYTLTN
jgi:hypothetical protein